MTLIAAVVSRAFCSIAVDRRISDSSTGRVIDDEYDKSHVLFCVNARVIVSFSGLASVGNFITHDF
jgi:hypothetical protein